MEAALRDQIVTAINLLGGAVSHLRGFHHQDPPMKPCDVCGNEVTQRWRLSTQSRMPHDPSRHTANNAALELLQTKVCDRLCTDEPATVNRERTTDAGFVRRCLQRHLHRNVAAYACYKCVLPAIREASCIAAETQSVGQYTRPTTREVDLTNYHAICRGDIRATNTILETPQTRIEATDLDPWGRHKARGTVLLDATGKVGIVVTRVPVPPSGTIRAYVRMVGAITTTKLRVPADIWDVDKCLAWSDEEVEQATVRLDIHTDGQRTRRLLWIPSEGVHTAGESSKATVTCTEFVNQKRRSHALQQLTQQPESNTLSRKRAPSRLKVPAETPSNEPVVPKRSRPADPVQDPDPAESSVARPKGSAGAELLLAAAATGQTASEMMGEEETLDESDVGRIGNLSTTTEAPRKKRPNRRPSKNSRQKQHETTSKKHAGKRPRKLPS